ncbi:MAG: M23 family metallopeptidase [Candidatus Peribacteria bacterium]|nr:M23 family metallopeptidase [Candidatus Peribacteria bacterium]
MCFIALSTTLSCSKDDVVPPPIAVESVDESAGSPTTRSGSSTLLSSWGVNKNDAGPTETLTFYAKPNTNSPISGGVKVKMYFPNYSTGTTAYYTMSWNSSSQRYEYQGVIYTLGATSYRFVDSNNNNLTTGNDVVRIYGSITLNENSVTQIYWPFGWDGSTWNNPWAKGKKWEKFASSHSAPEENAQDWNWGNGSDDDDRAFCSPITGVVTAVGWGPSTYGNLIDIEQNLNNGKIIRIRVAHLTQMFVQVGDFVGPKTIIGTIGMTGGSSTAPHLHCALQLISPTNKSLQFEFSK